MFAFVISLVVVGAAVVLTTRIVVKQATEPDQPATPQAADVRGASPGASSTPRLVPPVDRPVDVPLVPSVFRRIRSAVLLVAIVTVLGALTALLVVIGGAILLTGVRNAVQ